MDISMINELKLCENCKTKEEIDNLTKTKEENMEDF